MPHASWYSMSGLGLMLPSTSPSIVRPFGPSEIQRPLANTSSPPVSPMPSMKRKYDWSVHQDAPMRPTLVVRPKWA